MDETTTASQSDVKVSVVMTAEMRDQIAARAEANDRSVAAEVRVLLNAALATDRAA